MKYLFVFLVSLLTNQLCAQGADELFASLNRPATLNLTNNDHHRMKMTFTINQPGAQPVVALGNELMEWQPTTDLFEAGILLEKAGKQKNGSLLTFFLTGCAYSVLNWADVLPSPGNEIVLASGLIIGGILNISGNANLKKAGRMLQL